MAARQSIHMTVTLVLVSQTPRVVGYRSHSKWQVLQGPSMVTRYMYCTYTTGTTLLRARVTGTTATDAPEAVHQCSLPNLG